MKTYRITIKPFSGFGTLLKGDTLFGHICWQAVYDKDIFGKTLDALLNDYSTEPFIVVSSAYPKLNDGFALKRPDLPIDSLFSLDSADIAKIIKERKRLKSKHWMFVSNNKRINDLKSDVVYMDDNELFERILISRSFEIQRQLRKKGLNSFIVDFTQPHNTINRLTGTTGEGQFAPYSVDEVFYMPDSELIIFVGLREDIKIEQVMKALSQIGINGFGKDASTGLGRFKVIGYEEIDLIAMGSENPNACYTLAPSVPKKENFVHKFFTPFIRFGRHGDVLAKSGKPFKNPVIMADEGAVFITSEPGIFSKPYIGSAVMNISKAEPNAVTQGYTLYIPVRVEGINE